ncbi:MAG: hypothetical protein EU549_02590 [Promethearchaeota archaeon]|nr:MAG: hypothetical protein EU549_02590 [Candidatus Lokiarchaeota archaeon]
MILITTSRNPNPRTRRLCNSLSGLIPDSTRINRGRSGIKDLILQANKYNSDLILIIDSMRGNPSRIRFLMINGIKAKFHPLEIYIDSIILSAQQSRKKFVNKNYQLIIASSQRQENLEKLGITLGEILKTEFRIINEFNKDINYIKMKQNDILENTIVLYLTERKKKINIVFFDSMQEKIGPEIIVKDYKQVKKKI